MGIEDEWIEPVAADTGSPVVDGAINDRNGISQLFSIEPDVCCDALLAMGTLGVVYSL